MTPDTATIRRHVPKATRPARTSPLHDVAMRYLDVHGIISPADLREVTGCTSQHASAILVRMMDDGDVVRRSRGVYVRKSSE